MKSDIPPLHKATYFTVCASDFAVLMSQCLCKFSTGKGLKEIVKHLEDSVLLGSYAP